MTDEAYMRVALAEARRAAEEGEVPVGAVVVYDKRCISRDNARVDWREIARVNEAEQMASTARASQAVQTSGAAQENEAEQSDKIIIALGHNRRETTHDPSAHAEFSALVAAAHTLGRWRLTGCTVYVTLEPCLMCAGLMVNARIDRCVYGAPDPKGGALGTLFDVSHDSRLNNEFDVTAGVLSDACANELRAFFRARRAHKN